MNSYNFTNDINCSLFMNAINICVYQLSLIIESEKYKVFNIVY